MYLGMHLRTYTCHISLDTYRRIRVHIHIHVHTAVHTITQTLGHFFFDFLKKKGSVHRQIIHIVQQIVVGRYQAGVDLQ